MVFYSYKPRTVTKFTYHPQQKLTQSRFSFRRINPSMFVVNLAPRFGAAPSSAVSSTIPEATSLAYVWLQCLPSIKEASNNMALNDGTCTIFLTGVGYGISRYIRTAICRWPMGLKLAT